MCEITLIAVGDISLQTMNDRHPFKAVETVLKHKDILFGNLETVLSNRGKVAEKAVVLNASPSRVSYLKEAGFDILNIANNHILDLGIEGFHNTLAVLRKEKLAFIGANDKSDSSCAIVERKGVRFGFLGYCEGVGDLPENNIWMNKIDQAQILRDIEFIKSQCDCVIISLHWGVENVFYPSPKQISLARRLIDNGASVVLGHHSHVAQGIEWYKHGLIAYSLGNFQFDHKISYSKTNESFILCLDFQNGLLENYRIVPVVIDHNNIPVILSGESSKRVKDHVENISQPIKDDQITWDWWFEQIAGEYLSGNMKSFIIRIKRYGVKHLLQCIKWLICPFCLCCYAGIIRRELKKLGRK
jgi:poly-gamma-glutamate synthesis protein (capsule biosynthesis protein)